MSYATQRPRPAPRAGRQGAAYKTAVAVVRERAKNGERCYFEGQPHCPGGYFNLALPHNHRHAFTAHHLDRLMDGGAAIPDPSRMAPAHRGCNARDGLQAQNRARMRPAHGNPSPSTLPRVTTEWTSQAW